MKTWISLAWKEFWLPFFYWRKEGCPGGRDFLWLTVFLSLLLTLSLMMFASSEGVLNRFVDVLLGKKAGAGVPVWITPNILNRSGINFIDSKILEEIENQGFKVAPYRDIEVGFDTFVEFPGENVWGRNKKTESTENVITSTSFESEEFNGWAVYQNDPLWVSSKVKHSFPLKLILNKTLFSRNFNYEAYHHELSTNLPRSLITSLPDHLSPEDIGSLDSLWLRLRVSGRNELVLFDIIWTDYIHAVEKVAFLFPLATYHVLQIAHRYPTLKYFPESHGDKGLRIQQILIGDDQNIEDIREFLLSTSSEMSAYRGNKLVNFKGLVPESYVTATALKHNLEYQIMSDIPGDNINHLDREMILPCNRIPEDQLADMADNSSCSNDGKDTISLDVTDNGNGFRRALVYIPDRTRLFDAVESLLKIKKGAISIHPVYQDALNKFAFLTRMIESMRQPFGFILFVSLVALVGIQLFTLVGHRRHRYGMFLSKGFEWWQIYLMLLFQISLSLSVGAVVAVSAVHIIRKYLEQAIRVVAIEYKETLSLVDLNLMPLSTADYLSVSLGIMSLSWILAIQVLYFMPLRRRTHPAYLFQQ